MSGLQKRFDAVNASLTKLNSPAIELDPRAHLDNDIFNIKERATGEVAQINEVDLLASNGAQRVNRMRY